MEYPALLTLLKAPSSTKHQRKQILQGADHIGDRYICGHWLILGVEPAGIDPGKRATTHIRGKRIPHHKRFFAIKIREQILQKSTKDNGVIYERGYASSSWGSWSIVYSGASKVLWTGGYVLTASQTVTFSEPLSQQQSGVVLVFSRYISNAAVDYFYYCHFIPKQLIPTAIGAGQTAAGIVVTMNTNKFEAISSKYLRFTDTGIVGDDANSASGTSNGVTYNNGLFALRYVIGV